MLNTDAQLVRRCLNGKTDAFTTLYQRHAPRVFRLLRQLCGNATEAEDLTQETFLAAHKALAAWRGEGAFGTWLCGIAYKRCANARRGREQTLELLEDHLELPDPDSDPLLHCTRRERERLVEQAIQELPPVCRDVFVLVKVEGFSYREVAQLLEVPLGTVQSRIWRAIRLLQIALASEQPVPEAGQAVRANTSTMHPNGKETENRLQKPFLAASQIALPIAEPETGETSNAL